MSYIIEVLRQEHRNIETLLCVLERELSVFDRGERRAAKEFLVWGALYDIALDQIGWFHSAVDMA